MTVFVFPAGEASKTLDTVRDLYEHLILEHFERKDMLIALGGGVVGDLTGYAAATYLRGIDFVRFPPHCSPRWTAALAERPGWILTAIKTWWEPFTSLSWSI